MKRTFFCVALILCMAIMAGCAAQASGKTQTPISAKAELTSAQKADDTAEVATALLPSQTVEENSKTEDSADAPLPVERANASENADNAAEKQPTAVETAPPAAPKELAIPAPAPEDKPAPAPTPAPTQKPAEELEQTVSEVTPNLRLSLPPAGTSTPSRRLSGRGMSMHGRSTA